MVQQLSVELVADADLDFGKIVQLVDLAQRKLVEAEAKDAIRNFKNPICGEYVMEVYGLSPCREIGVLKEYVKEAILDGQIGNNFEEADAFMRVKAAEMGLVAVKG